MKWSDRLKALEDGARRTHGFIHNIKVQKLYARLTKAVEDKNKDLVKELIVKVGF